MSSTYSFSPWGIRGAANVRCSSQYACHFGSIEAGLYRGMDLPIEQRAEGFIPAVLNCAQNQRFYCPHVSAQTTPAVDVANRRELPWRASPNCVISGVPLASR